MIKIITAIGNANLNNELKKYEEFYIIGNDIIYVEGIIELLESNKEINYIILGELFNKEIIPLIDKIKEINNKIKIIFIINNTNKELEKILYKKGINDIFYEDENIENLINYLKSKNIEYLNVELREEINNLKKIILENNNSNKNNNKKLIIGFSGTRGIGKTTACILFANALNKRNKILIVDYNFGNSQIGELYNKKIDYSEINENNFDDFIVNVDKNIDIFIGLKILNYYKKIDYQKLKNKIKELKSTYDYIFIDTSIEENISNNLDIYKYFDCIIILSGIKNIDLNKTKKIINLIKNKQIIENNKINIIYYRLNIFDLLKIIFNKKTYNNILDINCLGLLKNDLYIKKEIIKENKLINKLLVKRIIKKI